MMKAYKNIDEYIANFPVEVQKSLEKIRQTIQAAAPEATEAISYGIPTFKLHGNLVHFGGYPEHIGFYPGSEAITVFADELKDFKLGKGTIQFPLEKPIPFAIVRKITEYRVQKNALKKKK